MACGIVPEVLNQNNYTPWSLRLKTYLIAKDLWDVVQTDPPEVGCPSDEQKVWEKRSAEALHAILLSCGDDILSFISDTTLAKSAWNILQDKFDVTWKVVKDRTGHKSGDDDSYLSPLFEHVSDGDWNAAKVFLDQHPEAIREVYSGSRETIIHTAIDYEQFDIVKELLLLMREEDLEIRDGSGNTPLINAIMRGRIEIDENMIEKNKNIVTMRAGSAANRTPVLLAFSIGFYEIARKLYAVTPVEELTGGPNEGGDGAQLITLCFYTQTYDIARNLIHHCPRLTLTKNYSGQSPLYALAGVRSAFLCGVRLNFLQRWIYKLIHVKHTAAETPTPTNDLCLKVENPQDDQGDQPGLIHSVAGLFRGLAENLLKLLGVNHIYEMKSFHVRTREFLCFMSEHITCETQREYSELWNEDKLSSFVIYLRLIQTIIGQ